MFKVTSNAKEVKFSIDHQTFTLHIEHDESELPRLRRNRWYARQLRVALKRLQNTSK